MSKLAGTYAIAESATIATAVKPPKIGSNISITSLANFFLSIAVMITFLHLAVTLKRWNS
ncbi:hypothetical protein FP026_27010 [Rhizobium tropici]|uniref:Uncharacterized protein n=1 Tax=Rhizobium tropici TaxID=398 RepID=A0A5B0VQN8_RHITR|nr:hypothetical protein [Rhizobium tropici]KAA1176843.1 hypothetical protein FP026_27010 [Rhizobium tropici]